MVDVNGVTGAMDGRVFSALSTYRQTKTSVYFGQFLKLKEDDVVRGGVLILEEGSTVEATTSKYKGNDVGGDR